MMPILSQASGMRLQDYSLVRTLCNSHTYSAD